MIKIKRKVGRPSKASKLREKLLMILFVVMIFAVFGFAMTNIKNYVDYKLNASTSSVTQIDISSATITNLSDYTYTGQQIRPKVIIKKESIILRENKDYIIIYQNNVEPGMATIIIKGIGNYKGTISKKFQIKKSSTTTSSAQRQSKINISSATIYAKNVAYTGTEVTPIPTVKLENKELKYGVDFLCSYKNNVKAGKASIIIRGIGNYVGSKKTTFNIMKSNIKLVSSSFPLSGDRCSEKPINLNIKSNFSIEKIEYSTDNKVWKEVNNNDVEYKNNNYEAVIKINQSYNSVYFKVYNIYKQYQIFGSYKTHVGNCPSALHFINVGEGDSILIESKGQYGLIDAGNAYRYDKKYNGITVRKYLKSIGVNHLDFVIATHSDQDHIGGIRHIGDLVDKSTTYIYKKSSNPNGYFNTAYDVMANKVNLMFDTNTGNTTIQSYNPLNLKYITSKNMNDDTVEFVLGDYKLNLYNLHYRQFKFTSGYEKTVDTSVNTENTNSLIILVTSKLTNERALLMGDVNILGGVENYYGNKIGKVDLLKLGHHGYITSNSKELIDITKPKVAILSNSRDVYNNSSKDGGIGSFGVPRLYLKELGIKVYKTGDFKDAIYIDSNNVYNEDGTILNTNYSQMSTIMKDGTYKWHQWIGALTTNIVDDNNHIKNYWYYIRNNQIVKNEYILSGKKDKKGRNIYYYYEKDGKRINKNCVWVQLSNGKWQFYDETGKITKNKTYKIGGQNYKFDKKGICVSGSGC